MINEIKTCGLRGEAFSRLGAVPSFGSMLDSTHVPSLLLTRSPSSARFPNRDSTGSYLASLTHSINMPGPGRLLWRVRARASARESMSATCNETSRGWRRDWQLPLLPLLLPLFLLLLLLFPWQEGPQRTVVEAELIPPPPHVRARSELPCGGTS